MIGALPQIVMLEAVDRPEALDFATVHAFWKKQLDEVRTDRIEDDEDLSAFAMLFTKRAPKRDEKGKPIPGPAELIDRIARFDVHSIGPWEGLETHRHTMWQRMIVHEAKRFGAAGFAVFFEGWEIGGTEQEKEAWIQSGRPYSEAPHRREILQSFLQHREHVGKTFLATMERVDGAWSSWVIPENADFTISGQMTGDLNGIVWPDRSVS